MAKKLIEIASEIVQTQATLTPMSAAEITSSLRQVFKTLQEMQKAEESETAFVVSYESELAKGPALEEKTGLIPEKSIQNDKVICLECGAEMRQLTGKHLSSHGLSQKDYKKKYGFSMRTPLAAKALTKARSKAAKKRGLPEKLKQFIAARRREKAESNETVTPSSKTGKGSGRVVRRKKAGTA